MKKAGTRALTARGGNKLAIAPNNHENEAKSHFCLVSLMSIRMEVNAPRIL